MAVSENPRDPQAPRQAPEHSGTAAGATAGPAGLRSVERVDRDLTDAQKDSQFEVDRKSSD